MGFLQTAMLKGFKSHPKTYGDFANVDASGYHTTQEQSLGAPGTMAYVALAATLGCVDYDSRGVEAAYLSGLVVSAIINNSVSCVCVLEAQRPRG